MNPAIAILSIALFVPVADDPKPKAGAPAEGPMAEAKEKVDREEWEDAAEIYRNFLEANPSDPRSHEARFWAGYCLVKLGANEQAEELLAPFEGPLADDKFADDALLQLGRAWLGLDKKDLALAAWKRHLEKYPESVWRTEVALSMIEILFHQTRDFQGCFEACDRLVKEVEDRGSTTEARYAGAYCLNALRRFSESEAWTDRLFDPESPLEEGWRRLLAAHRELIRGQIVPASAAIESLAADFPDLDQGERKDLLLRTSYVLRFNDASDRARELLLEEIRRSGGRPEDEVEELVGELGEAFGEARRSDFLSSLAKLSGDLKAPVVVRVASRKRLAETLIDEDRVDQAVSLLRKALADEATEYARFRAATQLAGVLDDKKEDRAGALKVLESLLPRLGRRDLIRQAREAIEGYKPEGEGN